MLWRCRNSTLDFSDGRPRVMGILNVTPDSFSDGGKFLDPQAAVAHALAMIEAGADIIDIGGESSRPGSAPVPLDEELRRVIPVVEQLTHYALRITPSPLLSVDTTKAEVARRALDAGAHIVNDISAGRFDPAMLPVAAQASAGVVLMHAQGTPQTMQQAPRYDDAAREVADFLRERIAAAQAAGIGLEQIAVDPGIGFGKTVEHNMELLARLDEFRALGRPLLVGVSRKSFLGRLLGAEIADRLSASLAAAIWAVQHGANIVRVHDVAETVAALRVIDELRHQSRPGLRHGNQSGPHVPCGQSSIESRAGRPAHPDGRAGGPAHSALVPFDPKAHVAITTHNLPHWQQGGRTYFVTFRLADSLPQDKLRQIRAERAAWLKHHPEPHSPAVRAEHTRLFTDRLLEWLDAGLGACRLRQPPISGIVETTLRHFDGSRYALDDYVVMPNHVHALLTPLGGHDLAGILKSWKTFIAKAVNETLGRKGAVWQSEFFDHIVRSSIQLTKFRDYIRSNPAAANLKPGEYRLGHGTSTIE